MSKKKLLSDLFCGLRDLQGLEALLQVGLKRNSVKRKIDLLAICDDGGIEKYFHSIRASLEVRWPTENFLMCDDSVRFDLPMGSGGIAVYDSTLLVRQVEDWIEGRNLGGQHRPWATGHWLPEALCGDLATAETLYDITNISIRLRELLATYPISLSKSIVELCTDEIAQKLSTLEKLHKNETLERELCLSDITASMVRLAFARSQKYLRGFRSLEQQAKLLRSSDMLIYEFALELSKRKRVEDAVSEIKKLL